MNERRKKGRKLSLQSNSVRSFIRRLVRCVPVDEGNVNMYNKIDVNCGVCIVWVGRLPFLTFNHTDAANKWINSNQWNRSDMMPNNEERIFILLYCLFRSFPVQTYSFVGSHIYCILSLFQWKSVERKRWRSYENFRIGTLRYIKLIEMFNVVNLISLDQMSKKNSYQSKQNVQWLAKNNHTHHILQTGRK